ncbi:MAG: hypothetical protein AAGI07_14000 [Bacteroidota bacterium]
MKHLRFLITLFIVSTHCYVFAQQNNEGRNLSAEDRAAKQTAHMEEVLSLDETTLSAVEVINLKYALEQKEIWDNTERGPQMREEMLAVRTKKMEELKGVLTNEQYTKFVEMQKEMQANRGKRRRRSGSNP